jgi:hypothetical protein
MLKLLERTPTAESRPRTVEPPKKEWYSLRFRSFHFKGGLLCRVLYAVLWVANTRSREKRLYAEHAKRVAFDGYEYSDRRVQPLLGFYKLLARKPTGQRSVDRSDEGRYV